MRILVLGSGAREHAIILALRSEEESHAIFAAPGNAGIAREAHLVDLDPMDPTAVLTFAQEEAIDLVVFIAGRGTDRRVSTIARVDGLDPDTGAYTLADLPPSNPKETRP